MVKPAAPWFGWGLVLWLVSVLVDQVSVTPPVPWLWSGPVQWVAGALAFVATVLLAVGVYRLVQHADHAAGYRPPTEDLEAARQRRAELDRQARARAALAATADDRPGADDEGDR
ncbi:hypothetical protein Cfla_2791 [Cellulomonas flavigena DSM 20109]|uniref:Uncharacterized protein n=1 Tax=Cellulomonas flavigena (strain ATCC 482 / DSM 20109 / BCRC 11376 / JCM 18109 / NBRC 3775 / NCIMB 8073 / NRS 134) TaxID=446466 RepID=D5UJN8_CELFN|nr:hypothetical protein [Cellulomonas flavigena]ADG75676.1 hypothetical protein Cfla_2791 [Cellulomonas flavigena DSM 20109]